MPPVPPAHLSSGMSWRSSSESMKEGCERMDSSEKLVM